MAGTVKESQIQRAIMDYLAAERIPAWRMNSGAMSGSHKGKKWFVRFGERGMADILAAPLHTMNTAVVDANDGKKVSVRGPVFLWIEVKNAKGAVSPEQAEFGRYVEANRMFYLVARSVDDVREFVETYCVNN